MTAAPRTEPPRDELAPAPLPPRARSRWRWGTPVVVLLCGSLFVVSGTNSQGTDLRPGRYRSLASLTEGASQSYQRLQREASVLEAQVDALTTAVDILRH